jgi:hypothetical protein
VPAHNHPAQILQVKTLSREFGIRARDAVAQRGWLSGAIFGVNIEKWSPVDAGAAYIGPADTYKPAMPTLARRSET